MMIRDSAHNRIRESGGGLGAEQRWTVSNNATSIAAAKMGLGFAWFAEDTIRAEIESGQLKRLPMRDGGERYLELYLVFADRDYPGRGAWRLAEIIRTEVKGAFASETGTLTEDYAASVITRTGQSVGSEN